MATVTMRKGEKFADIFDSPETIEQARKDGYHECTDEELEARGLLTKAAEKLENGEKKRRSRKEKPGKTEPSEETKNEEAETETAEGGEEDVVDDEQEPAGNPVEE